MVEFSDDGAKFSDPNDAKSTLKKRLNTVKNMLLTVDAYKTAAEAIVFKHTKGEDGIHDPKKLLSDHPDYEVVKEGIKSDFAALKDVEEMEYGPLADHIQSLTSEEVKGIQNHFPKTEALLDRLGKPGFLEDLTDKIKSAQESIQKMYLPRIMSDINKGDNKEHALDYILEDMGIDKKKTANYKLELMRQDIKGVVGLYLQGDKAKDLIKKQYDL